MSEQQQQKYVIGGHANTKIPWDLQFGRKTLIFGPNESGKSSVTDAFYLALWGFVPRLAGKDRAGTGTANRDLMWLVADGSDRLEIELTFNDGSTVTYATTGGAPDWAKPGWMGTAKVFDLRELRSQLQDKGDDARRRFFLAHATGSFTEGDLLARFPKDEHALWTRFSPSTGTPVDRLLAARDASRKVYLAKKAEAAGAESTLEDLVAVLGTPPAAGTLQRARENAQALLSDVQAHQSAMSHNARLDVTRTALNERIGALKAREQQAKAEANALLMETPPAPPQLDAEILQALVVVSRAQARRLAAQPGVSCALCAGPPLEVEDARARADQVKAAAEQFLAQQHAYHTYHEKKQRVDVALHEARTALTQAEASLRNLEEPRETFPQAVQAYGEAQAQVARLEAAQGGEERAAAARQKVFELQSQRDKAKVFSARCETIGAELLKAGVDTLESRVSKYLPPGERFRLLLEFRGQTCCLIGLERQGTVHVALSDSTWDRVVLALAAALSEDCDYALLVGEDRAYDPETLRTTMEALAESASQVILTSPVKYSGRKPKGWEVIDMTQVKPPEVTEVEPAADGVPQPNLLQGLAPVPETAPDWVLTRGSCVWQGLHNDIPPELQPVVAQGLAGPWLVDGTSDNDVFILHPDGYVTRRLGSRVLVYSLPQG